MKSYLMRGALLSVALGSFLTFPLFAKAYYLNASDMVGQVDHVTGEALWTQQKHQNAVQDFAFSAPQGQVVDGNDHRLFVADASNNRVLVFNLDSQNELRNMEPDYVLGQATFSAKGAAVTQNGLDAPIGLAYATTSKRLFVADFDNSRVMVFDLSSGITNGMNASFVLGQSNFSLNVATTSQSGLRWPGSLTFDSARQWLFVSSNDRVMVYDLSSGITNGMNASFVLGQAGFDSAGTGTAQNTLICPQDMSYDAVDRRLFAASGCNHRVMVFDLSSGITNGMNASFVLGQTDFVTGSSGVGQNKFNAPSGLSYDSTHKTLFVSDANNNRVMVFDLSSGITNGMNASFVLGQPDFATSSSGVAQDKFSSPTGLTYDPVSGNLFVSDNGNNRVMIFDVASIVNGEAASDIFGEPNPEVVENPNSSFVDVDNHRLFVAENGANRVLVFNLNAQNDLADKKADYVLGQPDLYASVSAVSQNGLNNPSGLAYDRASSRLFVSDSGNHRIMVYDLSSGITNGMSASFVLGQPDFDSNAGLESGANVLNNPNGILYDSVHRRLFVADGWNSRVVVFDLSSGIVSGMNAIRVLGRADLLETGSAGIAQGTFSEVRGLAYDPVRERLFVSDSGDHRVMVFDLSSGITNGMNASYVLGQTNFTSVTNTLAQNILGEPHGLAYSSSSQLLFVSDITRNAVMVFDVATISNGENAINVLGQDTYTGSAASVSQSTLSQPRGMGFNESAQRLYVADAQNGRVMEFRLPVITTDSLSSATEGQRYAANIAVAGGVAPYACSLVSGVLPAGVSLGSDCSIVGTPSGDATYSFVVRATDSSVTPAAPIVFSMPRWLRFAITKIMNIAVAADVPPMGLRYDKTFSLTVHAPVVAVAPVAVSSGGGLPPEAYMAPAVPAGGLRLVLNEGARTTSGSMVAVRVVAGSDAKNIALSNSEDFSRAIQRPIGDVSSWNLCASASSCSTGTKTVYAKVYTRWGRASDVFSASIEYGASSLAPSSRSAFSRDLRVGDHGSDVKALQAFLNARGFTVAESGAGSRGKETQNFGSATKRALIKFQEVNRRDILAPAGLSRGTGTFGAMTRRYLNTLQ